MAKCIRCGKSLLFKKHYQLSDAVVCDKCGSELSLNRYNPLICFTYDDVKDGVEAYLQRRQAASKEATVQDEIANNAPATLSTYKIVGVSYENDQGKDIQQILSKYVKKWFSDEKLSAADVREELEYDDRVYVYPTMDINVDLIPTTFDGEPAVKVMIEDDPNEYIHIGWIPKQNAAEVSNLIENYDCSFSGELVGGPYKYEDEDGKIKSDIDGYGGKVYISYK